MYLSSKCVVTLHCQLSCSARLLQVKRARCFRLLIDGLCWQHCWRCCSQGRWAPGCGYVRAAGLRTAQSGLYNMHSGTQGAAEALYWSDLPHTGW